MQPFDLEKALAGAQLVTRDWREVTGFGFARPGNIFPYNAYVGGSKVAFTAHGTFNSNNTESFMDLFLVAEVAEPVLPLKEGDWVPSLITRLDNDGAYLTKGRYYRVIRVDKHSYTIVDGMDGQIKTPWEFGGVFDLTRKSDFNPDANGFADKIQPAQSILEEAQALIYGERQADYGSVTTNFTNIAKGWEVILGGKVTPEQVALCLAWVKIARQTNKPKHDSLVDIAGYIGCIDKLSKGE